MITYDKTLIKKLFGGTFRKSDEKEKRKKTNKKNTRMAVSKLFALNANAISDSGSLRNGNPTSIY